MLQLHSGQAWVKLGSTMTGLYDSAIEPVKSQLSSGKL